MHLVGRQFSQPMVTSERIRPIQIGSLRSDVLSDQSFSHSVIVVAVPVITWNLLPVYSIEADTRKYGFAKNISVSMIAAGRQLWST
jgi:hypothetical protein